VTDSPRRLEGRRALVAGAAVWLAGMASGSSVTLDGGWSAN
jgi:hypothetical protein